MKTLKKELDRNDWQKVGFLPEEENVSSWVQFCMKENVGKQYWNVDPKDFSVYPDTILPSFFEWDRRRPRGSLFLHGPQGSGKSHAGLTYLRYINETRAGWTRYTTPDKILAIAKYEGIRAIQCLYGECDYLMIDDLGVETPADWEIKALFALFDARYSNQLPTIITSNASMDQISKIYGIRVSSRLQGVHVLFPNIDLRKVYG